MVDIQVISAIAFVLFLIIFLFFKRKNIVIQKILFPLFYLILYRSNFGIKFMNKVSEKYRSLIQTIGYICIGLGFVGMVFISINIIYMIYAIIQTPSMPGVALVLPFTYVPGIGYLSFFHWIIAIFILAIIHEFAHGIVAHSHGLKIKSSGFAFFSILVPIIPAAFVEPDEKQTAKKSAAVQYSIFAAGPMANIFLALILLLLFPYVANPAQLAPFESTITEPVGFSFDLTNQTLPAAQAGLQSGMIINSFNNQQLTHSQPFLEEMFYCAKPGQTITLGTANNTYSITPTESDGRALIGINAIKNERRIKPEYEYLKHPFYWTKDLIKWLFLLNFFIGLFNLLPLGIVDGGRMLNILLQSTMKNKIRARKIWGIVSTFFLILILFGLASTYIFK